MHNNLLLANPAGDDKLYVEDVFSTWLYTGNGSTQTITNGIALGDTVTAPVGYFATNTGLSCADSTDLRFDSMEDFTVECWVNQRNYSSNQCICLKGTGFGDPNNFGILSSNVGQWNVWFNGDVKIYGSNIPETNKWFHVAVCRSGTTVRLFVNGQNYGSASYSGAVSHAGAFKIGTSDTGGFQYQLQGSITNFRLVKGTALYTSNFTPPSSPLTAVSNTKLLVLQNPSLFTDNSGLGRVVTNYGVSSVPTAGPFSSPGTGKGGLVWLKERSPNGFKHDLFDTARGYTKQLSTNETDPEYTQTFLSGFNSNGFGLNTGRVNSSGSTYASWTFRKAPKFFDVVTWSGNDSSNRVIPHSLGTTPGFILIKNISVGHSWLAWHRSLAGNNVLALNETSAQFSSNGNVFSVNSTSFSVAVGSALTPASNYVSTNAGGTLYVAYLFAHDTTADGVIQCGSFTTDASGNATVNLGWEPQFILWKSSSNAQNWYMHDSMRGMGTYIPQTLYPNLSNAEATYSAITINSTGFSCSDNASRTYIYLAIRRGPMRVPTDATKVFAPAIFTGDNSTTTGQFVTTGFPVDLALQGFRNQPFGTAQVSDRLRGITGAGPCPKLLTYNTNAEGSGYDIFGGDSNIGVKNYGQSTGYTMVNWLFRRAPGFFDVVCYTASYSANPEIKHNLGVAPELVIAKSRTGTRAWYVAGSVLGGKWLNLNDSAGSFTSTTYTGTTTYFKGQDFNWPDGSPHVAYLFASCPGVSKVGSYTGNGSSQNIDCGFTNGARFVLIKRTDSTGGWLVYDTARGINVGNDPYLLLNSTVSEVTTTDYVAPLSTGFTVNPALSVSGGTYIYLAIA